MKNKRWAAGLESLALVLHQAGSYVCVPLLTLLVFVDVGLRYLFNSPLLWGNEVAGLILLLVFLVCQPYCASENRHIRMEIFYNRFGRLGRAALDMIAGLAGFAFAGLLLGSAIWNIPEQIRYHEAGDISDIPFWPFSLIIAFCGLVLCLQFLIQMVRPFTLPISDPQ